MKKGFSLLELIIALGLIASILETIFFFYQNLKTNSQIKQSEIKSLENSLFFLEKFGAEVRLSSQILNSAERPTDDWHFSFLDSQNRPITYYLDNAVIKRKLDATQPLTEENLILNQRINPARPLFYQAGNLVKIELCLQNMRPEPLQISKVVHLENIL